MQNGRINHRVADVDKIAGLEGDFRTPGRVDVEPPSVADILRESAATSPRAYQAVVDDVESEVVEVFSPYCPNKLLGE
jgi:hypothetical protein